MLKLIIAQAFSVHSSTHMLKPISLLLEHRMAEANEAVSLKTRAISTIPTFNNIGETEF